MGGRLDGSTSTRRCPLLRPWGNGRGCVRRPDAIRPVAPVGRRAFRVARFSPVSRSSLDGKPVDGVTGPATGHAWGPGRLTRFSFFPFSFFFSFLFFLSFFFFFFKDFIYLFDRVIRDSQREREHKQGEWERKKQAHSGGA